MDKFSALSKTFRPSPLSFKKYCRRGNERMLEIEDMRKGYKMSFFTQDTANAFINSVSADSCTGSAEEWAVSNQAQTEEELWRLYSN